MLKSGTCIDCDEIAKKRNETCKILQLIAGRCGFHYKIYRNMVCSARKSIRTVGKPAETRIKTAKKQAIPQEKPQNLVLWYTERMNEFTGRCLECGETIPERYRHASVAHVLPKSKFPSIAVHPENCMELGAGCGCHSKYDSNWLSASKMKILPLAKEKFRILEPFILEEEKRRIPQIFLD